MFANWFVWNQTKTCRRTIKVIAHVTTILRCKVQTGLMLTSAVFSCMTWQPQCITPQPECWHPTPTPPTPPQPLNPCYALQHPLTERRRCGRPARQWSSCLSVAIDLGACARPPTNSIWICHFLQGISNFDKETWRDYRRLSRCWSYK